MFTRARELQASGLYPYFKAISTTRDNVAMIEGHPRIMLGSNNYLGLTDHPKVLEASANALRRFGSGCTGSRFLNGTLELHEELEARLAAFLGKETCLVYSTGYSANTGMIAAMVGRGDMLFIDKQDHASVVDGARLALGGLSRFRHLDVDDLDRRLSEWHGDGGKMVMVDGVFSMEGTISDISGLHEVAKRHDAVLAVDDAHALGVLGADGSGTAAHFGLADEVEVVTGTFSKSLASIGGFVASTREVIHYLRHTSRPLMFSASLPPASTAGVLAALDIVIDEPERRERLWENTRRLREGLESLGFDICGSETPILPVRIGTGETTFRIWRRLYDGGVFTNPVVPPAVPEGESRLRTSVVATHSARQIDRCLDVFEEVARELDRD